MGAVRITILIVAAVIAVGLALVVGKIVSHKPAAVAVAPIVSKPMTQVVIAHRDLPVGTRLAAGDLAWQPWPANSINPTFITNGKIETPAASNNPTAVVAQKATDAANAATTAVTGGGPMATLYGAVVREPILANEPVTNAKLVRGGAGGYMAVVLKPGMRAMAVPVDVKTAAGGFILPGDHVDVLQAHSVQSQGTGGQMIVSQTLLRNVRVLAIDQASEPPKNGSSVTGTVATLEVAASDAEIIARGKATGEMILALRPYSDAGGPTGSSDTNGVVHIIRNGVSSDVMVTP